MGPSRKARSVKRFSHINEVSPNKKGENDKKSIQRKRKLADMLGPQWGREELERFYKAYRKYGMNWKKVVAAVRNRSVEMVEALYTMNRAYLSLPEGTATVDGLIAMMIDHYCNLAGSDSEQESNDAAETSQRPQKRARFKVKPTISKGSDTPSHSQAVASGYGCLSLLKKRPSGGSRPRAVGKRTPRFPVSYSYENHNGEKYFSPSRQGLVSREDDNDDEVAHEIALVLTEASQRCGSPQVSETPNRRAESVMSSPRVEVRMTSSKNGGNMGENDLEESMEADNGDFSRDKMYFTERETSGKFFQRRKLYGSKLEIGHSGNDHIEDVKEACSGTEEGKKLGALREKFDIEVTGADISRSPSQGRKKRSKKALFKRDESLELDALQTLANLSLMMPTSANENDSPMQVKEENNDLIEEPGVNHQREKHKSSAVKAKANLSVSRLNVASEKALKPGKVSILDASVIPECQQEAHRSSTKMSKKKQKFLASKTSKTEGHSDANPSESQVAETGEIGKKLINMGKRSAQSASPKLGKHLEGSSSSTDPRKEGSDTVQSTAQVPPVNQVSFPTKVGSRRKMNLQKLHALKGGKFYNKVVKDQTNAFPSLQDRATDFNFKAKISNSLSNYLLRRWCAFEWFYSAIDYPWFAKREFVEYLFHVGLGHVPRLTHVEWGVIRSSLGKPRRFSEQFLKEEKEKLNQYRDSVREHYTELRLGTKEGLPTDLAKPLSVGQRVIAIHPKTREIHDGGVLTVDHNRCRVQFDRPELGVEFVKDIDCMPLNPSENMPTSLTKHMLTVDKFFENVNELKLNGWSKDQRLEGCMKISTGENVGAINFPSHVSSLTYPVNGLLKQVAPTAGHKGCAISQPTAYSQPCTLSQIQAKEADVQALAELTRALEKKEAVVLELRHMNDDVLENRKDGDYSMKDSEPFKKQYAAILVQLNEVNEQVSSALYCLRQRNTYQGSLQLECPRPVVSFGDPVGLLNSSGPSRNHAQESGPHVNEIVESSRTKARITVDAAMQAISSLKVGGNTIDKIEEAIDYVNDRLPLDDSCMPTTRSSINTDSSHCSLTYEDQLNSNTVNLCRATDPNMKNASDRNEAQIPSELITHCVATLLMIQRCTERQFPPADVAQILDSAVTSLQPCCSQNLPVYAEIQKCMGIIKNQILALVPT